MDFQVFAADHLTDSFFCSFVLLVEPTILPSNPRITTILNSTTQLPCVAEGTPKPMITWRKDRRMVDVTDGYAILDTGMLVIERTQLYDAGRFSCIAQNEAGHDMMEFVLEVHGKVIMLTERWSMFIPPDLFLNSIMCNS